MKPAWANVLNMIKDVHTILKSDQGFSDSERSDMQSCSAPGGGFLCFQASKIPAPQILGYSQLAPQDDSLAMYTPFGDDEFE
jgi:hypothetical protein